ncbi:hypothetical protein JHK84_027914 [Glycine max]|nr:hypothetical protein JHK86_027799 [Glycine max]KAG5151442.1 hypothetical protein JHK84_027914 [Glycine max]
MDSPTLSPATRVNTSLSFVLELLQRIARVIKDYLGILNEDSLRKTLCLCTNYMMKLLLLLVFLLL